MVAGMFVWKYFVKVFVRVKYFLRREKVKREAVAKEEQNLLTSFWLGLGILCFTYRADVFLFLGVALTWYFFTKLMYRRIIVIPLSWVIVIASLYLNEQYDHLRFVSAWFEQFVPVDFFKNQQAPLLWTNILNMNFLKMLSFTLDCYWGDQSALFASHAAKCAECSAGELCYKGRDLKKLPEISLRNYLDYLLFAPTCLAGPPISYKSFHSFRDYPSLERAPFVRWASLVVFF